MSKIQKSNLLIIACVFLPIIGALFFINVPPKLTLALNQYLFILIPCIVFMLANKMNIKKTLKLNPMKISDVLRVILLAIVILPITGLISKIASGIFGSPISEVITDIVSSNTFPYLFFVIAITPAICEEVIMRGVVLDSYKKFGFKKAVILNGILFGMLHMNFHQFFYTAFLGTIFAIVVWYTKSIFASMIMHLVNNGLSVAMSSIVKIDQETINQAAQLSSKPSSIIISVIFFMISLYLTYYILRAIRLNNITNFEKNYNTADDSQSEHDIINKDLYYKNTKPYYNSDNTYEDEHISDNLIREYNSEGNGSIFNISFVFLIIIFIGFSALTQLL
ncbi:CPBP family intramembrane glutamic endopeptidase [Oceanirhabdus seepicola]|uniref:CPBP family intramembrane metalloprotease n=1 Tax=Oceanirhabdus seepicola TaxID=2828781 RepID=A0A9J6P9I3_9CLOT|nr:type II CAAX endopeptidase family protein [Oceanirhabdus seepicola]MCM1992109.1 CPBP family intramembrane metalloprotease [Oceanirhabdus seepicola]